MKRVWRLSDAAQAELFYFHRTSAKPITPIPISPCLRRSILYPCIRRLNSQTHAPGQSNFRDIIGLFSRSPSYSQSSVNEDLTKKVTTLRDELVRESQDFDSVLKILQDNCEPLIKSYPDGSFFIGLLRQLDSWPHLGLEVFNWRRLSYDDSTPITPLEYSKGIKFAGRNGNIDHAVGLFKEAAKKGIKTASTYNALMSAFMFNGLADKCQSLFQDMRRDASCSPTIVTYNILISVFGRLMLIDHMEATLQEIHNLNLSPNISTYNNLIAGYITAWMWDSMERTFQILKSTFEPNTRTYLLILRGYAHSGNLDKMEETYLLVRHHVNEKEIPLIRTMICAYCRSSASDRVEKIESLLKLIPENEYRPWLNVLLIRLYAQEDWLEEMENSINEAFERKTSVITASIMRCIITTYFRRDAVDGLANFVRRAECAGWRICRSLYHCMMVMYASQNRLEEMEGVLDEMGKFNLDYTKKTFFIMYNAYLSCGQRSKVEKVLGLMCKHGHEIPLHLFPS